MNKSELVKDIKAFTGSGLITRKQLADYCGKRDPHGVDRFLYGLVPIDKRYYFIPDVVDSLMNYGR